MIFRTFSALILICFSDQGDALASLALAPGYHISRLRRWYALNPAFTQAYAGGGCWPGGHLPCGILDLVECAACGVFDSVNQPLTSLADVLLI